MKAFILFVMVFLLASGGAAIAQAKTEVLTNKNVVDLYKAGLNNNLIITKIQSATAKFDVSTAGLISLKKESLPEDIIEAMVNKTSLVTNSSPIVAATGQSLPPAKTSASNLPEPEIIGAVYFYDAAHKLMALEKSTATMRTHTKALGYGGAQTTFEIDGDKSKVRINSGNAPAFIVNTGGGTGDGFVLYKVETKKGKRQAIAATFSSFSGMKGSKGIMPVDVKMVKPNIFQLIPSATLDKGEYFFAGKSAGNALSSTSTDVYAFGVD